MASTGERVSRLKGDTSTWPPRPTWPMCVWKWRTSGLKSREIKGQLRGATWMLGTALQVILK